MTHRPERPGVCFVTGRAAAAGRPIVDVARGAIEGGCELLQVREKDLMGGALLTLAHGIVDAAKPRGARCTIVVNDRLDVALAAKAAGVHLPADGLSIAEARRAAGKKFVIGRSVHSLAEARQAQKDGADYLFFGPLFETQGKTDNRPPQGPDALRKVLEAVRLPVWAIGGVKPETAVLLRGLPIAGVAAISFIAAAPDPADAVRALRAALVG
ncbi:MAG TPA: thiamine phosphate synthase [Candidatus Polarisedimenticolia bacterium]|nr:thiamine phosphate synthase [Candidatus Polarisedimenticolia bacterium]